MLDVGARVSFSAWVTTAVVVIADPARGVRYQGQGSAHAVARLVLDGLAARGGGRAPATLLSACIERTVPGCVRTVEEGLVERPAVRYNGIGIRVERTRTATSPARTFDLHHLAERSVEGCPTLVDNVGH